MRTSRFGTWLGIRLTLLVLITLAAGLVSVPKAGAVVQFSRKYELTCSTCHTAFPRLNYFGEQFMQNGYQLPETTDGSEKGKTTVGDSGRQVSDMIGNHLGIRLSLDAVKVETKYREVKFGDDVKGKEPDIDLGNANWLQLFTAGSLYKNISIFIETEIEEDKIHNSWFRLGFHNLLGQGGLANIRVGNTSMMDWHVVSGRLRMISNVKTLATRYKSSDGDGEDSVNMSSATPGISFYGYTHGLTYQAGIFNGAEQNDPNRFKNYSGTLKYQLQEGDFAGSGISAWGMLGTDTPDVKDDLSTPGVDETMNYANSNIKNNFWRFSPGLNFRFDNNLDLIVAYFVGSDDNYTFVNPGNKNDMTGWLAQIGYNITPEFFAAVQYDYVKDDKNSQNSQRIIPSFSYFIKENIRLLLTANIDILNDHAKQDEYSVSIRAMF